MPTELKPLQSDRLSARLQTHRYATTVPTDINNASQTVGWCHSPISLLFGSSHKWPSTQATLWDANGDPTSLADGPHASIGLRINNNGTVLFYYDAPRQYFVGPVGATAALETLVDGQFVGAVDLNDHDVVLGYRVNADDTPENFLYHLTTGELTILPPFGNHNLTLVGVDNNGRVLATIPGPFPTNPQNSFPYHLYWLPAGGDEWRATGITTYDLIPALGKSGLALASISEPNGQYPLYSDQIAGYMDLNAPHPAFKKIPRTNPANPSLIFTYAADANAAGVVVGHEDFHRATMFHPASGKVIDLSSHFTTNGWVANDARAISDTGFITGFGSIHTYTPEYQQRGWVINPDRDDRFKDANWRWEEIVRILIGVIGGGGGIVLPTGGGPTPIGPEGPKVLDALSPERKDVLIGILLGSLAGTLHDSSAARELAQIEKRLLQKALDHLNHGH